MSKMESQIQVSWQIEDHEEVASTNSLAAAREPWTVVRALRQSGGRGTHGRTWVSGEGGLWMSAVLPLDESVKDAGTLPLLVGMGLCEICREFGGKDVRLRWPNDLMMNDRKVAGIMLDRVAADKVVVGIGVNLTQDPALTMTELKGQSGRLQDFLPAVPGREDLTAKILVKLAEAVHGLKAGGLSYFAERLATCWGNPKRVQVEMGHEIISGLFGGVDSRGNPLLEGANGEIRIVPGAHVWKLREVA